MSFCRVAWICFGLVVGKNHPKIFLPPIIMVFPQTVYCWGSQCCLKCVRLGWGAVSASLSLSPVTQFVSPFVSHLTLAGVLCPPRWACLRSCLPICLPPGFVFHLGWGAVSASLGLSPNLSPIWLCLSPWLGCCVGLSPNLSPNLSSTWLCLSPRLGCCVRLAGLVSQFVSHLALSLGLSAVLSPNLSPLWLCVPVFFPDLFFIWLCLSPWLGCCVRLAGLVSGLVSQFVSHLALSPHLFPT